MRGNYVKIYSMPAKQTGLSINSETIYNYAGQYSYRSASITKDVNKYDVAEIQVSLSANDYKNYFQRIYQLPLTTTRHIFTFWGEVYYDNVKIFTGLINNVKLNFKDDSLTLYMDDMLYALTFKRAPHPDAIFNREMEVGVVSAIASQQGGDWEFEITDISTLENYTKVSSGDIRGENRASSAIETFLKSKRKLYTKFDKFIGNSNIIGIKIGTLLSGRKRQLDILDINNYEIEGDLEPTFYSLTPYGDIYEEGGVKKRITLNEISNPALFEVYPNIVVSGNDLLYEPEQLVYSEGSPAVSTINIITINGKYETVIFDDVQVSMATAGAPTADEIDDAVQDLYEKAVKYLDENSGDTYILNVSVNKKEYLNYEIGDTVEIINYEHYLEKNVYVKDLNKYKTVSLMEFIPHLKFNVLTPKNNIFYIKTLAIDIDEDSLNIDLELSDNVNFKEFDKSEKTPYRLAKKLNKNEEVFVKREGHQWGFYEFTITGVASNDATAGQNWYIKTFDKMVDADFGTSGNAPINTTNVISPVSPTFTVEMINIEYGKIGTSYVELDKIHARWVDYPLAGNANFSIRFNIDGDWDSTYEVKGVAFVKFDTVD